MAMNRKDDTASTKGGDYVAWRVPFRSPFATSRTGRRFTRP